MENEQAVMVLDQFDASIETKESIAKSLVPFFDEAKSREDEALALVVTSAEQKDEIKRAHVLRMEFKGIRVACEKKRKEMKAEIVRKGKAIDGMGNIVKDFTMTAEEHLLKQENFVKIKREEELDELEEDRLHILSQYDGEFVVEGFNVRDMSKGTFDDLISTFESKRQGRIDAELEAESVRIAQEKADAKAAEAMQQENDRLKKEAEERDAEEAQKQAVRDEEERLRKIKRDAEIAEQMKKQQALEVKLEIERREQKEREAQHIADQEALLAIERKRQAKIEAKLQVEREQRIALEAADKAKAEAEAAEKAKVEEAAKFAQEKVEAAERAARLAPDREKLLELAKMLEKLTFPHVDDPAAMEVLDVVGSHLKETVAYILERVEIMADGSETAF